LDHQRIEVDYTVREEGQSAQGHQTLQALSDLDAIAGGQKHF
jgi:hypothetical protein